MLLGLANGVLAGYDRFPSVTFCWDEARMDAESRFSDNVMWSGQEEEKEVGPCSVPCRQWEKARQRLL